MESINMNNDQKTDGPVNFERLKQVKEYLAAIDKMAVESLGVSYSELVVQGSLGNYPDMVMSFSKGCSPEDFLSKQEKKFGLRRIENLDSPLDGWHCNMRIAALVEYTRRQDNWILGEKGNCYTLQDDLMGQMSVAKVEGDWVWEVSAAPAPAGVTDVYEVESNFPTKPDCSFPGQDIKDALNYFDYVRNNHDMSNVLTLV